MRPFFNFPEIKLCLIFHWVSFYVLTIIFVYFYVFIQSFCVFLLSKFWLWIKIFVSCDQFNQYWLIKCLIDHNIPDLGCIMTWCLINQKAIKYSHNWKMICWLLNFHQKKRIPFIKLMAIERDFSWFFSSRFSISNQF